MKNMTVSIIIPNYNGEKLLQKNLPKVIEACLFYGDKSYTDVEIIIVDDTSKDDSVAVVNKLIDSGNKKINIKLLKNYKNLGFASTVNRGIEEARGEVVVLLNTDVFPEKEFIDSLISHFKDENVFAVGCLDKSIENGKIVERGRGIGEWRRGFLIHRRGEVDSSKTLWVAGGSGAFKKSLWEKLGGLNELYNPFYWEDIDLSYRALKSGYSLVFERKSVVTHEHEEGAIKKQYSAYFVKTIAYRNQFLFVWKNATDIDIIISHILWLPYHMGKALLRGDSAFFVGFFKALMLFPQIVVARSVETVLYKKSDKEVGANS